MKWWLITCLRPFSRQTQTICFHPRSPCAYSGIKIKKSNGNPCVCLSLYQTLLFFFLLRNRHFSLVLYFLFISLCARTSDNLCHLVTDRCYRLHLYIVRHAVVIHEYVVSYTRYCTTPRQRTIPKVHVRRTA